MKLRNYIISTFLGLVPTVFIINSLGAGINSVIENNETLSYSKIISNPQIFLPILGFAFIVVILFFIKKKIFKK